MIQSTPLAGRANDPCYRVDASDRAEVAGGIRPSADWLGVSRVPTVRATPATTTGVVRPADSFSTVGDGTGEKKTGRPRGETAGVFRRFGPWESGRQRFFGLAPPGMFDSRASRTKISESGDTNLGTKTALAVPTRGFFPVSPCAWPGGWVGAGKIWYLEEAVCRGWPGSDHGRYGNRISFARGAG